MDKLRHAAPPLHVVQQHLAALILEPDSPTPDHDALEALIAVPPRGGVEERLRVYSGGYPARIEEALRESFPAVAHVLGGRAFHNLIHRYIAAVPLYSYNLNDAGAELPRFVQHDRLTGDLRFLPDLARLEWHVARAFHAHEQTVFDPAVLASWSLDDWYRATFRFQPWVALVTSEWPICDIWECRQTPIQEIDIDLLNRADHVRVRRAGYAVVCESLDGAEAHALGALLDGQTLGTVIAEVAERGGDPATVSGWFARWMALRMITGCSLRAAT